MERDTFVHLPTSLEYLRVVGGKSTPIVLDALESNLPNLNTVIFNDAGFVTGDILATLLLDTQAPIQTVHIDQCFNVSAADLKAILARKHHSSNFDLSELSISHMRDVDDAFIRFLFGTAPDLKVLNLSHTRITGVTIRMCADAKASISDGVKLDRLFVRGCEDVSSDAVAYGRERALEVIA
jgi:F-box/TPR repeat protein Pof3